MLHEAKKCIHCGESYIYQSSGYGCGNQLNDSRYCNFCKHAIIICLNSIPVQFEPRRVNINELPKYSKLTLSKILQWEKDLEEKDKLNNTLRAKRVYMGLFNLKTNDYQNVRVIQGQGDYSGVRFIVSTWEKSPDFSIEIDMEYDLINQKFTGNIWW